MITAADLFCVTLVPFAAAIAVGCLMSRWGVTRPLAPSVSIALGFWASKLATDVRDAWGISLTYATAWERGLTAVSLATAQQFRPAEAHDWLPLMACLAAIWLGMAIASRQRVWFLIGALLMCVLIPVRMLWSSVYFVRDWDFLQRCLYVLGMATCLAIPTCFMPRWDDRRPRPILMPILVATALLAAALTFLLTGSKTYGELGAALGWAFVGAWCGGLVSGSPLGYNDVPVTSLALGGTSILACAYSATPIWQALVLAIGLTSACFVLRTSDKPSRRLLTCALVAVIASTTTVVGVAAWRFAQTTKTDNPYSQYMK